MSGTSNLHNCQIIISIPWRSDCLSSLTPTITTTTVNINYLETDHLDSPRMNSSRLRKGAISRSFNGILNNFHLSPSLFLPILQAFYVFDWWKSCKNIIFFSVSHSLNVMDFTRYAPLWFSAPHGYHRLTLISLVRYRLFFPDIELLFNPTNIISHQAWMIEHLLQIWNFQDIHMVFFLFMYMSGSIPSSLRRNPIGVLFFKPKVSATLDTWKKISAIIKLGGQNEQLRYESSTLILCKELSSTIFALWVCQSGIGNTCPNLHVLQYIKAWMSSTDPVSSIPSCYRLMVTT